MEILEKIAAGVYAIILMATAVAIVIFAPIFFGGLIEVIIGQSIGWQDIALGGAGLVASGIALIPLFVMTR